MKRFLIKAWIPAFAGMTIVMAGVAFAWMGDVPTAGQQASGAEAAVAAPLKSMSAAPLGAYSIMPMGAHSL